MDVLNYPQFLVAAAMPAGHSAVSANQALFGWFDFIVVAMLVVGFLRGRKRGMSVEFMDVIQWLAIVGVGAVLYQPLGSLMALSAGFGKLFGYLTAYLVMAAVIKSVCTLFKRSIGEKLVSSESFGSLEYYMGMAAGIVRYGCMIIFFLALLNARLYTEAELKAQEQQQQKDFESIRFPTLGRIQNSVFKESFAGQITRQVAPFLLIASTPPEASIGTIKQQKDREYNRSLGL